MSAAAEQPDERKEFELCPFCGFHPTSVREPGYVWFVGCRNYKCEPSPRVMVSIKDAEKYGDGNDLAELEAKKIWNTRATMLGAGWQPIETAPRDASDILVAWNCEAYGWRVKEAWWTSPYEGAPPNQCSWRYDGTKVLLDKSVHGLGASCWMPKPRPPTTVIEGEQPPKGTAA